MYDFFSPISAIRKITKQKAEKNISEAYSFLINDFKAIALLYEQYHPLELLKLSLWDERKILHEKKKDSTKRASAVLLPVILQSVLSSTYVKKLGTKRTINEKDWIRLRGLGDDVLRRIIRVIENKCALFISSEDASDDDAGKYREIIAEYLLPDEVKENELSSESIMLRSLLEEKEGLEAKIGCDSATFWINVDNIAKKGLYGIDDLCRRVEAYSSDYEKALEEYSDELSGKSSEACYDIVTKKKGWEGRAEGLCIERDGFSLYALSSLSSLPSSNFSLFMTAPGSVDLTAFLELGYWPCSRFPFIKFADDAYTFVAKHIPRFISLSSSFNRRETALKSVLSIFFLIGVDTYTYDGNSIDISVLPSFYDRNLFTSSADYTVIKKKRDEEKALKTSYGHKRLIVDPDQKEEKIFSDGALLISSSFMVEATINRNKKHELIESLLGKLEFPETASEYKVIDEDEIEAETPVYDDASDDTITDEYEYDNSSEDNLPLDEKEESPVVEYGKKTVDIAKEEEKYALTKEIIEKEEEADREGEQYSRELDDDIFDDTEEEERLDEIGEREESDYYLDIDQDETQKDEETEEEETPCIEEEENDDKQLDFFNLLDEEEEKIIDDELEKEDENDFLKEEEKEEELDDSLIDDKEPHAEIDQKDEIFTLPGIEEETPVEEAETTLDEESSSDDETVEEEKIIDDELEKEDERDFLKEEEKEEELDDSPIDDEEPHAETDSIDDSFTLPGIEEETPAEEITEESSEEETTFEEVQTAPEDEILNEEETADDELEVDGPLEDEEDIPEAETAAEAPIEDIAEEPFEDEPTLEEDKNESGSEPSDEEETADDEVEDDVLSGDNEPLPEAETVEEAPAESFTLPGIEEETQAEEITEEPSAEDQISEEPQVASEDEALNEEEVVDDEVGNNDPAEEEEHIPEAETAAEAPIEDIAEEPFEDEPTSEEDKNESGSEPSDEEGAAVDEVGNDVLLGDNEPLPETETVEEAPAESFTLPGIEEETPAEDEAEESYEEEPAIDEEQSESNAPDKKESLDVNSWMKIFMGLDDEESSDGDLILDENSELPEEESIDDVPLAEPEEEIVDENEEEESIPDENEAGHKVLSMDDLEDDKDELPLMENMFDNGDMNIPSSGILYDIYKKLGSASVFASFLRDTESETQNDLEAAIEGCWKRMRDDDKDKLFNVPSYSLSIILSRDHVRDDLRMSELLNNAGGVMYARGEESWTAVILYINSSFVMEEAIEKRITPSGFSPSDWKRVTYIGEQMKKR